MAPHTPSEFVDIICTSYADITKPIKVKERVSVLVWSNRSRGVRCTPNPFDLRLSEQTIFVHPLSSKSPCRRRVGRSVCSSVTERRHSKKEFEAGGHLKKKKKLTRNQKQQLLQRNSLAPKNTTRHPNERKQTVLLLPMFICQDLQVRVLFCPHLHHTLSESVSTWSMFRPL